MNKSSVMYAQDINISQLTVAEKTDIKYLCRATPDIVTFQYHKG